MADKVQQIKKHKFKLTISTTEGPIHRDTNLLTPNAARELVEAVGHDGITEVSEGGQRISYYPPHSIIRVTAERVDEDEQRKS